MSVYFKNAKRRKCGWNFNVIKEKCLNSGVRVEIIVGKKFMP